MTPGDVRVLPVFRGWTVDERLQEFRRVNWKDGLPGRIAFVRFDTPKGAQMLQAYRAQQG